ncbi:MAG TPA: DUF4199 domain-containing protein [Bacteroidia bacterium]|jgi:hypothetical protein
MKLPISITLGLIAGLIFSVSWYLMATSMGFYSVDVYKNRNYLTFVLIFVGVFLSVFIVKRKGRGFLQFKDALKTGMLYSLVFAVIIALFNYIYYTFITPDTIDFFMSEAKKQMIEDKVKPEDFPKFLESVRGNYGSFRLVPPVLFWGLIISLLAGALLQKKDPHPISAN